jgi:hypothetical protein
MVRRAGFGFCGVCDNPCSYCPDEPVKFKAVGEGGVEWPHTDKAPDLSA